MSTASSIPSPGDAHRRFEESLPRIDAVIRYRLRRWPPGRRAEAAADARAAAWHAWAGLLRRGRDPLAVGVAGIAANACRYVARGRRFGCGAAGRSAIDALDPRALRRVGYRVVSLDDPTGGEGGAWRRWLVADDRARPADEAAFRIDFAEWLGRLPGRLRRIAGLLAEGHGTSQVARRLGVTPGAISQARAALARSWDEFQAQAAVR